MKLELDLSLEELNGLVDLEDIASSEGLGNDFGSIAIYKLFAAAGIKRGFSSYEEEMAARDAEREESRARYTG